MLEDADLKLAYKWFTHFDGTQINDPEIGKRMLDVRVALGVGAYEQVKPISTEISKLINNPEQAGETIFFIALITLDTKDTDIQKFFVARELLERVADYYYETTISSDERHFHYLSVFAWLRGYISWQVGKYLQPKQTDPKYPFKRLNQYRMDAIEAWMFCVRVLNELCYSFTIQKPGWYQEIRWRVTDSFYETRRRDHYYAISKVYHWYPPVTPVAEKTQQPQPENRSTQKQKRPTLIRSLPVYQYVPAGGWGVVDPDQVGQVEIENFIINEIPFQAIDLIGKGRVTLQEGLDYAIVRIKGTSMNLLDINNDDYVLIRRQDSANHMDIVLAERIGIDSEATLKRFYRQGKNVELRPDSDDPQNKVLRIEKKDDLRILGVAIAVFKPAITNTIPLNQDMVRLDIDFPELTSGMPSHDLFETLLRTISIIDMIYTQMYLIHLGEIDIASDYDDRLVKFLNNEKPSALTKNISAPATSLQTALKESQHLKILDFNKQLLEQVGGVPLRIISLTYASPGLAVLEGIKILEKIPDLVVSFRNTIKDIQNSQNPSSKFSRSEEYKLWEHFANIRKNELDIYAKALELFSAEVENGLQLINYVSDKQKEKIINNLVEKYFDLISTNVIITIIKATPKNQ